MILQQIRYIVAIIFTDSATIAEEFDSAESYVGAMKSSHAKKAVICFGTRPEAIKLAPLIHELARSEDFTPIVCVTAQHRQMLDQVLRIFDVQPEYDLNIMSANQNLDGLTATGIVEVGKILDLEKPDCVIVQGDTTSTFFSALAAFYRKIPVVHIEAGLRTYQKYSPFPEELNRKMTSALAEFHFAPTTGSRAALIHENIDPEKIFVVGNTVIDALVLASKIIEEKYDIASLESLAGIDFTKRFVLITGHRRENFGTGFEHICHALKQLSSEFPDVEFIYPVHLNPNVRQPVMSILTGINNLHLLEPLDYPTFIWLLKQCFFVITDSGGIQEEAPTFHKPVLVMRETTERPEVIEAGVAKLVGTDCDMIVAHARSILTSEAEYHSMAQGNNPYGDGTTSAQVVEILRKQL